MVSISTPPLISNSFRHNAWLQKATKNKAVAIAGENDGERLLLGKLGEDGDSMNKMGSLSGI